MRQEGAEADNQMNRLETCGYDERKIAGSPLLPGAFGQHTLPPQSFTPTDTPGQRKAHVVQGPHWVALL